MPTKAELKAKADEMRRAKKTLDSQLAAIDRITGEATEKQRVTKRNRARDASEDVKNVKIPPLTADQREWREMLESDLFDWLAWFGEKEFTRPLTDDQKTWAKAIRDAAVECFDQSFAAPRGEGKSLICEWVLMYLVLTGICDFVVLFAATGPDAESSLDSIKMRLEEYERLAEYYPEVCEPIRALEYTAQRARTQTVSGTRNDNGKPYDRHPSRFSWCGKEITLPDVPGSKCAGHRIATRGLDAAIRGMKRGDRRPRIAVIDDPDTDETVNSEDQAKKLEKKIDRNIAGLSGQEKRLSRVMLTTIQNRTCVSFKYTDPIQKPSFHGKRFAFLVQPPLNENLWSDYVALRQIDWQQGTATAHEFYLSRREEMDAGAVVSNPYRRGDSTEVSALQFYFNEVARLGQEAVDAEYQNNPAEDSGPIESGITPFRILKKLSGFKHREIPPGCTVISQGIDVGKRYLHWVVRAWGSGGDNGYTIDYGVQQVYGVTTGSEEGLDDALREALCARMEEIRENPYETATGTKIDVGMTLVDARYRTSAIYTTCESLGLGIRPVMGFGKSHGCVKGIFTDIQRRTTEKRPGGDGWFESRKKIGNGKSIWCVDIDADRWKSWEHDRWMTAPDKPGCLWLYGIPGEDPKRITGEELEHQRRHYPSHICAEVEVEETIDGVVKRYWKAKGENHWLDASSYANVAAHMIQGTLHAVAGKKAKTRTPDEFAPTARELARQARGT